MKKIIFLIYVVLVVFLLSSCLESHQEKGRAAFDEGNYELAVEEWSKTSFGTLAGSMIDKWNYGIALEKLGREEEAHDIKISVCTSLASDNYLQDQVNSRNQRVFEDIVIWSNAEYEKQQASNHKSWLKENHFMELSKIEKGVYYMMEVGDHQDTKETLGYIPEYRLFPKGEFKEVINDEVNGTYNWSRESDTHVTFYNFNAWTDTMITGDLYLNDDDSLSMYVEGDYVGKLYMRYKVKE
jgi:PBP1b-binding outer membrane lipoprotein LpoB